MGELHLFLSRATLANSAKSDRLHDAVLDLAATIDTLSSNDEERKELARDARWLLREIVRDGGA
jgi:hypothetical protein